MTETLYQLEQLIEKNLVSDYLTIIRKNSKIFDFVLDGEQVRESEKPSKERLEDVLKELRQKEKTRII